MSHGWGGYITLKPQRVILKEAWESKTGSDEVEVLNPNTNEYLKCANSLPYIAGNLSGSRG